MVDAKSGSSKSKLEIHRIYVKASLFEASAVNQMTEPPEVEQSVHGNVQTQESGTQEAVLTVALTGKHQGSLIWHLQLQQAGLYTLRNLEEEQQKHVLYGFCMSQLYPYACAEVNHLLTQGGFLPVSLAPVNFQQAYVDQQKSESTKIVDQDNKQTRPIVENIALLKEAIKSPTEATVM